MRVSRSLLLKQHKEVFALQQAVFGQIRAMYSIPDLVDAKLSSERVGVVLNCFLRIVRATEFAELLDHVLLAYLAGDDWSTGSNIVCHLVEFRHNTLV